MERKGDIDPVALEDGGSERPARCLNLFALATDNDVVCAIDTGYSLAVVVPQDLRGSGASFVCDLMDSTNDCSESISASCYEHAAS